MQFKNGEETIANYNGGQSRRKWFTWEGKYTSGRIHYGCGSYETEIKLKEVGATNLYEDYGSNKGKEHDWVIQEARYPIRFERPRGLAKALRDRCQSKSEALVHFQEMEADHGCRVPGLLSDAGVDALFYFEDGDCFYDESWYVIHHRAEIIEELEEAERQSLLVGVDGVDEDPPIYHKRDSSKGYWEDAFYYEGPCLADCPRCKLGRL